MLSFIKLSRQYGEDVRWDSSLEKTNGAVQILDKSILDLTLDNKVDFIDLFEMSNNWDEIYCCSLPKT